MHIHGRANDVSVRPPAVAGRFYEGHPERLAAEVDAYLDHARSRPGSVGLAPGGSPAHPAAPVPGLRAIVVPHAGHIYSGPTAAYAFASIDPVRVERVVLLGPAHYVPVDGIGTSSAQAWRTPLGDIPLDGQVAEDLQAHIRSVRPADDAHAPEHSLEVQLPFLQRMLAGGWSLVPLIVGADLPDDVAEIIGRCSDLPGTLVVVSTDLSHYLPYDGAVARDSDTIRTILARDAAGIGSWDACGRMPLRGLLTAAVARGWAVRLLDARNSGDTAGDRDRVVGYAAFAVTAGAEQQDAPTAGSASASRGTAAGASATGPTPFRTPGGRDATEVTAVSAPTALLPRQRAALLRLARATIEEGLGTGRRPAFRPDGWEPALLEPGAAFVTLRSAQGALLGCIGSLEATRPLAADVAEHAFDAAFRDPRFEPLTAERAEGMKVDISVLGPPRPFPASSYRDLVTRLRPGTGLTVHAGHRRATFLPAVWGQMPGPEAFVSALWRKASLVPGEWPEGIALEVYGTEEFAEADA